ncbi:hypothetical protein B7495_00995 [Cryobacterium sp. LW097]|uniref:hypothetical protein n=1 Tax=Cryobacterium sp. LW097 TaxID=1978566 RepID=UPI000B4C8018|nr:hypothetical protein [Cryobacterium sp. LW097]ASD20859.1 hypothetical protein B7495_00995 [Cryobacterium sp. LW097]
MTEIDNNHDTLSRFVLRARRIAAHSLVLDRDELLRHAGGLIRGTLDTSGNMTMVQELPDSEEAFESLAARLRPLTVAREPIYYEKVLSALEAAASDENQGQIDELRLKWTAAEIQGSQVQAFALQQSKLDGSEATDFVSDTQLAAAWLYADLVHADATGPKRAALDFPFVERYAAAVRVFANMATLTVATLELTQKMIDAGLVSVASSSLTDEVVVGTKQLVREARAYVAEVGAAPPDLRVTQAWPAEWKPFTVTEMKRQDPANRVSVTLHNNDGTEFASYDSAVVHRDIEIEPGEWHVLVGGCTIFKVALERDHGNFVGGRIDGLHNFRDTNQLGSAASQLRLQMHAAASVRFSVNDVELFELSGFKLSPDELREEEVLAEVLGDIVAIEQLTGEQFSLCATRFTNQHRLSLRRSRLLHEGKLIRSSAGPLQATVAGDGPPQAIRTRESTLDVGGAVLPVLATFMWHPQMSAQVVQAMEGGTTYSMSIPDGERFLEWAPDNLDLRPDSDFSNIAQYELIGIAEPGSAKASDSRSAGS